MHDLIWPSSFEARGGRKKRRSKRKKKVSPFFFFSRRRSIEWVSDPRSRLWARNLNKSDSFVMSFSFFKPSRPKTPQEVVKAIRDSLLALDTKTVVEVKALEKVKVSTFMPPDYCSILDSHSGRDCFTEIENCTFSLGFGRSREEFFISERNAFRRGWGRAKCWSSCTVSIRVLQRRCCLSCYP